MILPHGANPDRMKFSERTHCICARPRWTSSPLLQNLIFGTDRYILLSILNVRHTTVYRYRCPVALGDHRLMLRPRDSHDLRLIQTNLNLSPPATLRWSHDVFGNSIAIASFAEPSPNCGSRAVSNWRQARALPWVSDFTSPPMAVPRLCCRLTVGVNGGRWLRRRACLSSSSWGSHPKSRACRCQRRNGAGSRRRL
jgi:hypothetical protein